MATITLTHSEWADIPTSPMAVEITRAFRTLLHQGYNFTITSPVEPFQVMDHIRTEQQFDTWFGTADGE